MLYIANTKLDVAPTANALPREFLREVINIIVLIIISNNTTVPVKTFNSVPAERKLNALKGFPFLNNDIPMMDVSD